MLSAFTQAFRTPDLRAKLLFTLGIMALFRLGSILPAPGVNLANAKYCIGEAGKEQNLLSLVNVFSGGALLQLSVFALGIMPYITASIIIQLLRVVIPRFEELHKEGQAGTAKLTEYTRYLTIGLGLLQSSTIVATAKSGQLFQGCARAQDIVPGDSIVTPLLIIITMTAGTGLIMWLGELITERGIGNGMSLLIFTSIVAQFPSNMFSIAGGNGGAAKFLIVVGVVEGLLLFATGMYWGWAVACVVLGIAADIIAGIGRFRSKALNFAAFVVYSLSPMGSYLMLWANPTGYASYLVGKGAEQAYMDTMMSTATDWMLPAMVLATVACAIISGLLGMRLLHRQFEKAGITA